MCQTVTHSFIFVLTVLVLASVLSIPAHGQIPSTHVRSTNTSRDLCPPVAKCIDRLDEGKECSILPVPKASYVDVPPPGSYLITKLRRGAWMYYDGTHQVMILKTGPNLAVVDFPESSPMQLMEAVDKLLRGAIPETIDMVYSHSHFDHIGGSKLFYNYIKKKYPDALLSIYGTTETSRAIRLSTTDRAVRPNKIVGRVGRTLALSKNLQLQMHVVDGHTRSDLLLYIPKVEGENSVLMLVDIVFPRWSPFFNLAITNDPREYLRAHRAILKFDFDVYAGGHVGLGKREDVIQNMRFTKDLLDAGATGLRSVGPKKLVEAGIGKVGDPSAPEFRNFWWVVGNVFRKQQIDVCYRIMLEKWGCQLAGLDLTLQSHCRVAIEFNIFDA